jgi:hypothetical protein
MHTAAKAFAFYMKLQLSWLTMALHATRRSVTLLPVATMSSSGSQAQPTAEELAHSMDIAIGAPERVASVI